MKIKKNNFDFALALSCMLLVVIGLIFVFSASFYSAQKQFGDKYYFFNKQLFGVLIGVVACIVIMFIKLDIIYKLAIPLVGVSVVLLALVFVPGIGISNYGANRWIGFGSFTFQPSELAKFSLVIFSAWYLSKYEKIAHTFLGSLPVLAVGGVFCLLIIIEPNMSITVCIGLVLLVLLLLGGVSLKAFGILVGLCLLLLPILILMEPYRLQRLLAFLDPWASPKDEGYQLIQSFYALGGGGLFGVGLFNSRQKLQFLPFAESDFIFSVIGEEWGFVGSVFVILLFGVVIFRGIGIALKADCKKDSILAGGITAVIAIQTAINLAVVSGSIPPTGLPLPFISYGGSSIVVFLAAVGILLNISRKQSFLSPIC